MSGPAQPVERAVKISAVILNWNAADLTGRSVAALKGWRVLAPDVVVVDNASRDAAELERSCAGARLVRSERNLGFAGGNNLGIRAALDAGAEAVLLLNNDAEMAEGDAGILVQAMAREPRLGIAGPLLRCGSESSAVVYCGGRDVARYARTRIPYRQPSSRPAAGLMSVKYVPGTAALIRAEVFKDVGVFDEDYFFSAEMADLCERAVERGWGCAVAVDAVAVHRRADGGDGLSARIHAYYEVRNRFLFIRRRRGNRQVLRVYWVCVGALMAIKAALSARFGVARALLLGVADGLAGRFGEANLRAAGTV